MTDWLPIVLGILAIGTLGCVLEFGGVIWLVLLEWWKRKGPPGGTACVATL